MDAAGIPHAEREEEKGKSEWEREVERGGAREERVERERGESRGGEGGKG